MSDAGCLPVCYARLCFAELCGMSDGGFELLYNIVDPKLEHGVPTITEYSWLLLILLFIHLDVTTDVLGLHMEQVI